MTLASFLSLPHQVVHGSQLGSTEEAGSKRELTLLPGTVSENSGNDFREVKGGGGAGRARRVAKPQSGRISHQDDCLVETSNFSSPSAGTASWEGGGARNPFLPHTTLIEGSGSRDRSSLYPNHNRKNTG